MRTESDYRALFSSGVTVRNRKISNYPFIVYNFKGNDLEPVYHDLNEFHTILPEAFEGDVSLFTSQLGIYLIGGLSKLWCQSPGIYDLPAQNNDDYRLMVLNWCDYKDMSIYNFCLFLPISIMHRLPTYAKIESAFIWVIENIASYCQLNRLNSHLFQEIKRSFLAIIATNFISPDF